MLEEAKKDIPKIVNGKEGKEEEEEQNKIDSRSQTYKPNKQHYQE